jgi:Cu/Ag efflux pump CusA
VPLALALILVLLYMSFHSIGLGLLIYLNVPFATIGGIIARCAVYHSRSPRVWVSSRCSVSRC